MNFQLVNGVFENYLVTLAEDDSCSHTTVFNVLTYFSIIIDVIAGRIKNKKGDSLRKALSTGLERQSNQF